jgi:hypothetical protein
MHKVCDLPSVAWRMPGSSPLPRILPEHPRCRVRIDCAMDCRFSYIAARPWNLGNWIWSGWGFGDCVMADYTAHNANYPWSWEIEMPLSCYCIETVPKRWRKVLALEAQVCPSIATAKSYCEQTGLGPCAPVPERTWPSARAVERSVLQ